MGSRFRRVVYIQVSGRDSRLTTSGFDAEPNHRYLNAGPGAVAGFYIKNGLDDGGRR